MEKAGNFLPQYLTQKKKTKQNQPERPRATPCCPETAFGEAGGPRSSSQPHLPSCFTRGRRRRPIAFSIWSPRLRCETLPGGRRGLVGRAKHPPRTHSPVEKDEQDRRRELRT